MIDSDGHLAGGVLASELLRSAEQTTVSELIENAVPTVSPETELPEVARLMADFNLLAIPVIDSDERPIGVIAVNDVIELLLPESIAVCLLDVDSDTQAARLVARGDAPALLVHHVAFADWMRGHAADPHHRPEVLQTDGWEQMHWERWSRLAEGSWAMHVLDTSNLTVGSVASEVLAWCRRALAGQAPAMRVRS